MTFGHRYAKVLHCDEIQRKIDLTNKTWNTVLSEEIEKPYFREICDFIDSERENGVEIYPEDENVLRAFELTRFEDVQVVILAQDPYFNPGQADGLAFSVPDGQKIPPSLMNIFKELGEDSPESGDLSLWAEDGVLLLNTVLTVERGKPNSHKKLGWQKFTDKIIKSLSDEREGLVFLLWGAEAQKKEKLIDTDRHHVLKTSHPSPLSARKGFLGCGHFEEAERLLGGS